MSQLKVFDYLHRPPSPGLVCSDPSRTQQQFKDEADINVIVRRFADCPDFVNPMDVRSRRSPVFGDFSNLGTFQEQQDNVNAVVDYFESLPSSLRAQFRNSPGLFAEFASNPENISALQKLGLLPVDEVIKDESKQSDTSPADVEDSEPEG